MHIELHFHPGINNIIELSGIFFQKEKMHIPIKIEDFFDAEISIYSRAGFLIYLMQIPHFICFVENLRTSLRKIYGHGGLVIKSLYKILSIGNIISSQKSLWKCPIHSFSN